MTDNPLDVAGKMADAAREGFSLGGKVLDRLEGIPARSRDRASARSIASMRRQVAETLEWCEREGFPQETADRLCTAAAEKFLRLGNLDGAISFARGAIGREPDTAALDPSWLMSFRRGAEDACDEEMQRVWGTLLAGELEQPGSYRKRTMSILADMERADADAFRALCGVCVTGASAAAGRCVPLLVDIGGQLEEAVPVDAQLSLNALGLTCLTFGMYNMTGLDIDETGVVLSAGGRDLFFRCAGEPVALKIYSESFTPYGRELSRLCGIGLGEGFMPRLVGWARARGVEVSQVDEVLPGGRLRLSPIA